MLVWEGVVELGVVVLAVEEECWSGSEIVLVFKG